MAGVRLCPAACCETALSWNTVLRQKWLKAKETVSAICCWHHSTAPCVRITEIALHVLRYETKWYLTEHWCCGWLIWKYVDNLESFITLPSNFGPQDPYCEWQINSSKKGDFQCSRRGRLEGSIRDSNGCPKVCNQWAEKLKLKHFCCILHNFIWNLWFIPNCFLLFVLKEKYVQWVSVQLQSVCMVWICPSLLLLCCLPHKISLRRVQGLVRQVKQRHSAKILNNCWIYYSLDIISNNVFVIHFWLNIICIFTSLRHISE